MAVKSRILHPLTYASLLGSCVYMCSKAKRIGLNILGWEGESRTVGLVLSSGHEGAHAPADDCAAYGAVAQAGCAVGADHQVTAGDEDDGHQLVHAHLAGAFLLQLPQLFLRAQVPYY